MKDSQRCEEEGDALGGKEGCRLLWDLAFFMKKIKRASSGMKGSRMTLVRLVCC